MKLREEKKEEKKEIKDKKKLTEGLGRKIYRVILFAFLYAFGAVACFAAVVLFFGTIGYIRTKTLYDEANAEYVNVVSRNQTSAQATVSGDGGAEAQTGTTGLSGNTVSVSSDGTASANKTQGSGQTVVDTRSVGEIQVDIKGLQQVNKDVVGWIYFEDGLISYPILYSGDNDKYLKRNYKGQYMASGSIFLEAKSAPDFSDLYTQIYGHNMRDLTMFGKLRFYKSRPGYYKDHGYFHIITADHDYRYQIFSCKQVASDSDIYCVIHKNTPGLAAYANTMLIPGSVINVPTNITDQGHILALSTCVNDYAYRMIVCGFRVGEADNVQPVQDTGASEGAGTGTGEGTGTGAGEGAGTPNEAGNGAGVGSGDAVQTPVVVDEGAPAGPAEGQV
jgi:SrtB family sortase